MRGLKIAMHSVTDKLIAIIINHIEDYIGALEYDINNYDPDMFQNVTFDVTKNYFIFNVRVDHSWVSSVKDIHKELVRRINNIVIRNMYLYSPKNVKIIFNYGSVSNYSSEFYSHILYDGCLFRDNAAFCSGFKLKDCEFM